MIKKCFVIQRFDGGRYDSLYNEVFEPAIKSAGFEPYRVDRDPQASIPIESIEREISETDACFVELSEDAPNVWFELGFAIARDKPLCLVCSKTRSRFPFDVQHRQIIRYPEQPVPTDYSELGRRITERLESVAKADVALQQNVTAAKALSTGPNVSGLRAHEMLALTIICQSELSDTVRGWALKQDMERAGYQPGVAELAAVVLKRKGLIKIERFTDQDGQQGSLLTVTEEGQDWLIEHQEELNLRIEKTESSDEITDDDIPF